MIATAVALNIRRSKSMSAIDDFVFGMANTTREKRRLMPQRSSNLVKMYQEVASEIYQSDDKTRMFAEGHIDVSEAVSKILKMDVVDCQTTLFLAKCKKIERMILIALLSGIFALICSVVVRNVIDAYLFCFLIWTISCISLWVTLRAIIKEWKDDQYGKKNKN